MPYAYSIRRRLMIIVGLAISVATLIQAGIAYRVALREVDDISDYHMTQIAYAVRRGMPEPALPPREHRPISDEDHSFSLQVTPLALTTPAAKNNPVNAQSLALATATSQYKRGFSTRQIGGKVFRIFTVLTQTQLIEVMHDEAVRSRNASKLALRTVSPILLLGPLLLLTVWWGISRALFPLMASRNEIARRAANDLHPLTTEGVPEEIQPFIREINVLFMRIGKAFAAQQHFVADAAHELRSPLTALRLQVQSLQRANSAETRDIAADRVIAGIDRATRLVEQMLVLAREEAMEQDLGAANLPQIVRLALSDVLPLAQSRNMDIGAKLAEAEPDANFDIRGNAEALRILLRNLLENAVKYTPERGIVNLSMQHEGRGAILCIEDSGPGIAADDRARMFERFRRGDHDTGGSGLGLSIVKTIAERHHIHIEVDHSAQLGGLRVRLHFPQI